MTETVLIAGTASHVGKSTLVAGLCRLLSRRGYDVAPFKAQNMSNNAQVAVTPSGTWGEIGVSQYVQATAADVPPTTDLNPVLLKPRGDGQSQLVIHGEALTHVSAGGYYEDHWETALSAMEDSYDRLAADHDVVIAEGAGSIAEINLHDRDLANVETARYTDAQIVIVVDIDRGGAFASLYGTLELMPADRRERVVGAIITKFRGDRSILQPGIERIEEHTGIDILGVIPFEDPGLPAEDSLDLPGVHERVIRGQNDGVSPNQSITVGVPRLPHISNFTDLEPLARQPGVRVAYLPLNDTLEAVDAVVLPGTKNTVDDLRRLQDSGMAARLRAFDGPLIGLCGGFQMLGERLTNASIESTTAIDELQGIGLLPVETAFSPEKQLERVSVDIQGNGPLAGATGSVSGYEIHMGRTRHVEPVVKPLGPASAATDRVLGTYLHGLFGNRNVRTAFVRNVYESVGKDRPATTGQEANPYNEAADLVENHVRLASLSLGP